MEQENSSGQPEPVVVPQVASAPQVSPDDKNLGVVCHLLGFFTSFLGPLILWLIKKEQSPYVDHHAKEALNFQITIIIANAVATAGVFLCGIGLVLFPVVWVCNLVFSIIALVAASKGELYKYPWTLRLIS